MAGEAGVFFRKETTNRKDGHFFLRTSQSVPLATVAIAALPATLDLNHLLPDAFAEEVGRL